jgi:hypothetical protein
MPLLLHQAHHLDRYTDRCINENNTEIPPMKILTWTRRLLLTTIILALIATNVLTLTSTAFNAAISGLLSTALGIQTVSSALQHKLGASKARMAAQKTATRRFGTKVTTRTKKLVATTVAELPAEAIPVLGITVLIAATAYEIKLACDELDDLDELYRELGMEAVDNGLMADVCHPGLPSIEGL